MELLNIWPMIRPGSNVSAVYSWLLLLIINMYISSKLLYLTEKLLLVIILVVILPINYFLISHGFLIAGSKPKCVINNKLMNYIKVKILTPFMMFPTFELLFRLITYKYRRLPDFYVFGEMKCGTTTLSQLLNKIGCKGPFSLINHFMSVDKESNYFLGIQGLQFTKTKYYSMCFPLKSNPFTNKRKLFDASPDRLWFPHIFKRIHSLTPNTKIIIMIRNPIYRTKSHLQHNIFEAKEIENELQYKRDINHSTLTQTIQWFENNKDIVNKHLDELEKLDINHKLSQYLDTLAMLWMLPIIQRSMYYSNIQRLLKLFERKQLLIINVEDLNRNLKQTLKKICKFIEYDVDENLLNQLCNQKKQQHANKALINVEMSEKEKLLLYEIFKEENKKLFEFLGQDLGWNTL